VIQKDFPLPRQPEVDPPVEDAGEGEGNPFAPPSPLDPLPPKEGEEVLGGDCTQQDRKKYFRDRIPLNPS
jgi:hypothetical protein